MLPALIAGLALLLPAAAVANFADGDGSEEDPWQIENWEHLDNVRDNRDDHFVLNNDLNETTDGYGDLASSTANNDKGWDPIGTGINASFTGSFDGQGHTISGLVINRPDRDNAGLFGHVGNDTASTLIRNVRLAGAGVTGGRGVGTLIGRVTGNANTLIEYCSSEGGTAKGTGAVGGLIGSHNSHQETPGGTDNPVLRYSYANVSVSYEPSDSPTSDGIDKFGGLAGCSQKGTILDSYARGDVTVENGGTANERVGGLAGCVLFRGRVERSYSTGKVTTVNIDDVGGLIGFRVGVGDGNRGVVLDSFWDTETSDQGASAGGTGKTTNEMKMKATFTDAGWDFENVWDIDLDSEPEPDDRENNGYPFLLGFDHDAGVVTWLGNDSVWDNTANWDNGVPGPTSNVVIETLEGEDPNYPVIAFDEVVEINNLTVQEGASLTVESGPGGSGTLIVTGTATGDVTVERWLEHERWYIVSPPVAGQDIGGFLTDADNKIPSHKPNDTTYYAVTVYDEENNRWKQDEAAGGYFTDTSPGGDFDSGTGYLMGRGTEDGAVSFTGELVTGGVPVDVTVSVARYGWNAVGNPYSSAIGVTSSATGSSENFLTVNTAELHPSFVALYVWDDTDKDYAIINNSSNPFGKDDIDTDYLTTGQGFLVRPKNPATIPGTGMIAFTPTMRAAAPDPPGIGMFSVEQENASWPGVQLNAEAGGASNSTVVLFAEGMTEGLDPGYDAGVMPQERKVSVFTRLVCTAGSSGDFDVQCLPLTALEDGVTVPVGLRTEGEGTVTVSFSFETSGLPDNVTVTLQDTKEENAGVENNTYTAEVEEGEDTYNRFFMVFSATAEEEEETYHNLNYTAGPGGTIDGESAQEVAGGQDGETVTAVPDSGYRFERWSDGITTAERTDTGVEADLDVHAEFITILQHEINKVIDDPGRRVFVIDEDLVLYETIKLDGPVTLRSDSGLRFIYAGELEDAIVITGDDVTVEGLYVKNFTGNGIVIKGSNVQIVDCVIDCTDDGGDRNTDACGILIDGAAGTRIGGNAIEDGGDGIKILSGSINTLITNNAILRHDRGIDNDGEGTVARFNEIAGNSEYGALSRMGSHLDARSNWWRENGEDCDGDVDCTNPLGGDTPYGLGSGAFSSNGERGEDAGRGLGVRSGETDTGELFAAGLGSNPTDVEPSSLSGTAFYWLFVDRDNGDITTVEFDIGYAGDRPDAVYWFDKNRGRWEECSDVEWFSPPNSSFAENGYDGYARVTIKSDGSTRPDILDDFSGVAFAVGSEAGSRSRSGSASCFLATAAYGTPLATELDALRDLRDNVILATDTGVLAVKAYYRLSPPLADLIGRSELARAAVRLGLAPLVSAGRKTFDYPIASTRD